MCGSVSTLAVGKPSSRPRWAPRTTTPSTRCGRPRISRAPSTSPSATRRRVRVEENGSPPPASPRTNRSTTSTSKSYVLPCSARNADVAGGLVAEAEVGALDDGLGVQLVDQDLDDEVGRRQLRELGGERQDQHRVHAQLGHQFGAAVVRGEQRRVAAGAHDLAGVRVEGDDDGGNAQLTGALHGVPDDQLVPAVHPVVGADGDDAAPPVLGDVLQATPALHCDRSSSNPCPY